MSISDALEFPLITQGNEEVKTVKHFLDLNCYNDMGLVTTWKASTTPLGVVDVMEFVQQVQFVGGDDIDNRFHRYNYEPSYDFFLRYVQDAKQPLNGVLLQYLLKNQELIPESWRCDDKGKVRAILFFGSKHEFDRPLESRFDLNRSNYLGMVFNLHSKKWEKFTTNSCHVTSDPVAAVLSEVPEEKPSEQK